MALEGPLQAEEVPLSNATLDAYLNVREGRVRADPLPSRADQAMSLSAGTPRIDPALPSALPSSVGQPSADLGQGEAAPVAAAAQAKSAQRDRLNGVAAVLAQTLRTPNESTHRERPSVSASERLGWRAKQSEQQA